MIVKLNIKNILSFKDETTLNMSIKNDTKVACFQTANSSKHYISNMALMYGKNNVGKTNVIKVIKIIKDLIESGKVSLSEHDRFAGNSNDDIKLELEILGKINRYRYKIVIDSNNEVVEESLFVNVKMINRQQRIYTRNRKEISLSNMYKTYYKMVSDLDSKDVLVSTLKYANNSDINDFIQAINNIIYVDSNSWYHLEDKIIKALENDMIKKYVVRIVQSYGTRISDIDTYRLDKNFMSSYQSFYLRANKKGLDKMNMEDLAKIPSIPLTNQNQEDGYCLVAKFEKPDYYQDYYQLSQGTKKLITMACIIFDGVVNDKNIIMLCDEIDVSLHANVVTKLLEELATLLDEKPRQIIATIHLPSGLDIRQISSDAKFLLEKDSNYQTTISKLSDYGLRKEHKASKRYLTGAYGAIPVLDDDFLDNIK